MDRVSNLQERIKSFLDRDIYISNDESISIYDLISSVVDDNEKMRNELWEDNCLDSKLLNIEWGSKGRYRYLCYYSEEKEYLKITVDRYKDRRFQKRIAILKSIEGDKILSTSSRFLKKYYNEIENSFSVLRKYQYLFNDDNSIAVDDDIFNVNIRFNSSLGIHSDIYVNYGNRKVLLNPDNLSNIDDCKNEIFKRICVSVSALPELYKKASNNSLERGKEKQKTYQFK